MTQTLVASTVPAAGVRQSKDVETLSAPLQPWGKGASGDRGLAGGLRPAPGIWAKVTVNPSPGTPAFPMGQS